jgi:hypothetical protein
LAHTVALVSRLLILGVVLFASRTAVGQSVASSDAEDPAAEDDERPHVAPPSHRTSLTGDRVAFLAHLGIGPPGGVIGVDVDVAPIENFAVNFGAGYSPGGGQLAVTPRLRLGLSRRVFLGLGTGLSLGGYTDGGGACLMCGEPMAEQKWQTAYWHNVEVAVDLYSKRGRGMAQFVIGAGHIINSSDYTCDQPAATEFESSADCNRSTSGWLGFVSAAYGFDL